MYIISNTFVSLGDVKVDVSWMNDCLTGLFVPVILFILILIQSHQASPIHGS